MNVKVIFVLDDDDDDPSTDAGVLFHLSCFFSAYISEQSKSGYC